MFDTLPTTPHTEGPVGGRLQMFHGVWRAVTQDSWVLNLIESGYRLEFTECPPHWPRHRPTPVPEDPSLLALLRDEVRSLLSKRAVVRLSRRPAGAVISSFFLAPKKNGKWRPILNLKPLNRFIRPPHFKMETLHSILPHLRKGMWATSIDLSDAYLHIPIHPEHRRFLVFEFEGVLYQFRALPFGLSTAPRVFTRVTRVMAAFIRRQGVRIFMYLDDWLLVANDPTTLSTHTQWVLDLARSLGWIINTAKSDLTPSQSPTFLGAVLDFQSGLVRPSVERCQAVLAGAALLLSQPTLPARAWLVFLGYLASLVDVVPWCRLRMRNLQWHLLTYFRPSSRDLMTPVPLLEPIVPHVQWWCDLAHLRQGLSFPPPTPSLTLVTDASLDGWGAHLGALQVAGHWSPDWQGCHINLLELEAVFRALRHFHHLVRGSCVLVRSDNMTTVAHINRQGGTHSRSLWELTERLLLWCLRAGVSLQARHLPGKLNTVADLLSRLKGAPTEWSLSPTVALSLWQTFGLPTVDLFASPQNRKLPVFCALTPGQGAWLTDAFSFQWSPALAYAFPPFALIPRVLDKVIQDSAHVLLIAPMWPSQTWFPSLLDLVCETPRALPPHSDLLRMPDTETLHPSPQSLYLTAWPISGNPSVRKAFRRRLPRWHPQAVENQRWACMLSDSDCFENGVRIPRLMRVPPLSGQSEISSSHNSVQVRN